MCMGQKSVIFIFMAIGSMIGGFIPIIWGDSFLTFSSIVLTAIGGLFGIYIGYKISN
jgi:hypothetical protein